VDSAVFIIIIITLPSDILLYCVIQQLHRGGRLHIAAGRSQPAVFMLLLGLSVVPVNMARDMKGMQLLPLF